MTVPDWTFSWDRGTAEVLRSGAMIGPVQFVLDDGETAQPFAIAPWSDDPPDQLATLPPLLRRLRGEWVCVPFGMPDPPPDLPERWLPRERAGQSGSPHFHGYSSNADWSLVDLGAGGLELGLDYPEGHPVRRVTRRIAGVPGKARLDFELRVETRDAVQLPIGIHPVFALPATPGSAQLSFGGDCRVATYPIPAESGVSRFVPDRDDLRLGSIPAIDGSMVDLGCQPLGYVTEELALVTGHGGRALLACPTLGYEIHLEWDSGDFPGCMLWISNGGRSSYPWNGRFRAIGIEPVVAPFDLGTALARDSANPLEIAGVPTARSFAAGERWSTRYSIELKPA